MLTNKIKAFTLGEIIVVLILTSIVAGLAFSVLSLVQSHMKSIQNNFNQQTELAKLEVKLTLDFNRYPIIEYNKTEEQLKLVSELDSTFYYIRKNFVVNEKDTFNIPFKVKSFFFLGNSVDEGLIDAVKLQTTDSIQDLTCFVYKINDATPFIK